MKIAPFDAPDALLINEARKSFLEAFLSELIKRENIATTLDAGCGFGFFSGFLKKKGFEVTAFDGRAENVAEAKRRNPNVKFTIYDVEDPSIGALGLFDLVLCFGLLYHLENPFRAIRNLASLTEKVLLVETVIAPGKSLATFLYEENFRQDQGLDYIALIPTESWFVKCFYRVGFPFVYKARILPDHQDFRSSLAKRQRRTVLVASRVELSSPLLYVIPEPIIQRHMWDTFGIGSVFEFELIRKIIKSGLCLFNSSFRNQREKRE